MSVVPNRNCPLPASRQIAGPRRTAALLTSRLAVLLGIAAAVFTVLVTGPSSPAAAASPQRLQPSHAQAAPRAARSHETASEQWHAEAQKVLQEAAKQHGKPYSYGADGPNSFDCSGLVRYVFLHALHKSLPHNAAEQYHMSTHIHRSARQPGDLAFVDDGGYVSHVGIYAGNGYWWVAPHTGERVHKQKIYSAHIVYGRVIAWPHNH